MDEYSKIVKKLNILEKLLQKPLVSIKRNMGDEEIINEINDSVKQFLTQQFQQILNRTDAPYSVVPLSPVAPMFSDEEVAVLKALVQNILNGDVSDAFLNPAAPLNEEPVTVPITPAPKNASMSPVMEALAVLGLDPSDPEYYKKRGEVIKKLESEMKKK